MSNGPGLLGRISPAHCSDRHGAPRRKPGRRLSQRGDRSSRPAVDLPAHSRSGPGNNPDPRALLGVRLGTSGWQRARSLQRGSWPGAWQVRASRRTISAEWPSALISAGLFAVMRSRADRVIRSVCSSPSIAPFGGRRSAMASRGCVVVDEQRPYDSGAAVPHGHRRPDSGCSNDPHGIGPAVAQHREHLLGRAVQPTSDGHVSVAAVVRRDPR
jgi:hypothetical protein